MLQTTDFTKWSSKESNFIKYHDIKSNLIYGFHNPNALVSIMILTYKRAESLETAVLSALRQDFEHAYEVVVVDDTGNDCINDYIHTDELMKELCQQNTNLIYYRHTRNLGQYGNWNRAAELCTTKYYGLLHDDGLLHRHYLKALYQVAEENERKGTPLGLISSWYRTSYDNRENRPRMLDRLIDIFMRLRGGRLIRYRLKDNVNFIYPASPALFINRDFLIEIGGLNDEFYPSSDFLLDAKMNKYYETAFLPVELSVNKVLGESASLKQEVCDDSIEEAFRFTYVLSLALGYSEKKAYHFSSRAAVFAELGVRGYSDVDYSWIKKKLGMNSRYSDPLVIAFLNLYSKLMWGLLLFRRN